FAGPPGPGPMSPNSSPAGRLWARTSNRAEMAYAGAGSKPRTSVSSTGPVVGVAGECEQVLALVGIQPERIRDCRQHTGRGPGLATLLQPRVPDQTDVGELGDLFPAQARDPPHPPIGQPHLG